MTKAELLKQLASLPDDCRVYIDPMHVPPVWEPNNYPLAEVRACDVMDDDDPSDPNDPIAVIRV